MRLTIARKIALAVIAIVILSIGTMAWVTSSNLQRGFVSYLNELQTQDLDQLRELLEERYRTEGNFEWLRHQPRALRDVMDQMKPRLAVEADEGGHPRAGRPPRRDGPPPEEELPPGERRPRRGPNSGAEPHYPPPPRGPEGLPPPRERRLLSTYPAPRGEARTALPAAAGLALRTHAPEPDPEYPRDPERQRDPLPEREAPQPAPLASASPALGNAPREAEPLPEDAPPRRAEGPPGRRDPIGFASRISIIDAQGRSLIGPPDFPPGIERALKHNGEVVARMRLAPLRQAAGSSASATGFLQEQIRTILLLSCALIGMAVLAAIWLARHLLRPVAALRDVTARLARGQFDARAPLLSRDELAELALHVNAMAEALEESERQRRKMLADVSHELRTPLTVIRGEIEALLDGIRQADAGALESLHAEVLRLNKLVDDLHQLTLADAGDLQYHWLQLDLGALLLPVLERYQPRAQKLGLELSWSLPKAPLTFEGDAGRLTQVVVNLLENSMRYTDGGGQIIVALSRAGLHAELTVEDSAPGVPDGAYASIFERLYRVDGARTRERGGSGLGLAICKVLVVAHGGSIVALPSVLGGVRMLIRLPTNLIRAQNK